MSFLHDQPDFRDLLQVVAGDTRLAPGLVEKDYWVTHVLWALYDQGFEVWFKGGTSLSKGFALIRRFSEDLDLKLMPGSVAGVPEVTSWTSEGTKATSSRKAYFEALEQVIVVSGATVTLDREQTDRSWRNAALRVTYPGHFLPDLHGDMRQYVLLEVGNAGVTPAVQTGMSSFVHDFLDRQGRPEGVVEGQCVIGE